MFSSSSSTQNGKEVKKTYYQTPNHTIRAKHIDNDRCGLVIQRKANFLTPMKTILVGTFDRGSL